VTTPQQPAPSPQASDPVQLRDHWWWRPGWHPGTRFVAWHFTIADTAPALADHVTAYQQALQPLAFLDLIPRPWLHLTVQGIDHTHALTSGQLDALTHAVRQTLAVIPAPTLTFDRSDLHTESVVIPPTDPAPVHTVRTAIRDAITSAHGPPEGTPPHLYRPHVSAAYVNTTADPADVRAVLDPLDIPPVTVTLDHITLMELHRDQHLYQWRTLTTARIGTTTPTP
jgi:hypothetical protein